MKILSIHSKSKRQRLLIYSAAALLTLFLGLFVWVKFIWAATATKKSACADFGDPTKAGSDLACHLKSRIPQNNSIVKSNKKGVEVAGFAPAGPWMTSQVPYSSTPTPSSTLPKPGNPVQNLKKTRMKIYFIRSLLEYSRRDLEKV